MRSVILREKEYLRQASPAEKEILHFTLASPERVAHMSIHELSREVFASPSTIGRLCKKLGFNNYREWQRALNCELAVKQTAFLESNFEIYPNDTVEEIMQKSVSRSSATLEDTESLLDPHTIEQCVTQMVQASSIGFFGTGASLLVAKDAYLKFLRLQKHCLIAEDYDVQRVLAKTLRSTDAAVLVSYSGRTQAMVDCARILKENKVPIIAITSFMESELSRLADYNLYVSATEYSFTSGKFTSRLSQLMVVDILYLAYIRATYADSSNALMETHLEKNEYRMDADSYGSQCSDHGKAE